MCHTQVKYQAATVKRKHKANGKMMQDEQNPNKNTGKAIQAKTSKKNAGKPQTQAKKINL